MVQCIHRKDSVAAKNALLQDGCVIVEDALDTDDLEGLNGEMRPVLREMPNCHGPFVGYHTKRVGGLFNHSCTVQCMALYPLVLEVMNTFLGPNCDRYQINLTQLIEIAPGEVRQHPHTDDGLFSFCRIDGERMINVMWALSDFTSENGATRIVPGSHLWEEGRLPQDDEFMSAEMPKGSALIYLGSLFHGGGANQSDAPRLGLVISYCLGWLRQAENQYLTYSSEIAKDLPVALQELIGYAVHRPNLGLVNNRNPMETIRPGIICPAPPLDYLTDEQVEMAEKILAVLNEEAKEEENRKHGSAS